MHRVVPDGTSLLAMLGVAALAALLSNFVNNLPATLVLLPVAAASGGVAQVLAVLIGVNIGPNLTYVGSLATVLWRRAVSDVAGVPDLRVFTRLGVLTAPAGIVGATCALWLSVRVIGV
jgi:arsenical pump membrane protein